MHMFALVAIPDDATDIEGAVTIAMAPYSEAIDGEDAFWDWWQIGGRYSGRLDGYDPEADPANIETCFLCHGTGVRPDMVVANGCNSCSGTGKAMKWSTEWAFHEGDVATAEHAIRTENLPYTIVTPDGVAHREHYDSTLGGFFEHPGEVADLLRALPLTTRVVVVDYHS